MGTAAVCWFPERPVVHPRDGLLGTLAHKVQIAAYLYKYVFIPFVNGLHFPKLVHFVIALFPIK